MQLKTFIELISNGDTENTTTIDFSEYDSDEEDQGVSRFEVLIPALKELKLPNLSILNLRSNELGDEDIKALAEAAKEGCMSNLRTLNLRCNQIGHDGVKALAEAAKEGCMSNLRTLNLGCNQIGHDGVKALAEAAKEGCMSNLRTLNLGWSQIGHDGVKALAEVLQEVNFPYLEVVDLTYIKIGDDCVKILAKALKKGNLPTLNKIILSSNEISHEGAKALAEVLQEGGLPSLREIHLRDNRLNDESVKMLAEALKKGNIPYLEYIDLSYNQIGDKGAMALFESFEEGGFAYLEGINLNINDVSYNGFKELTYFVLVSRLPPFWQNIFKSMPTGFAEIGISFIGIGVAINLFPYPELNIKSTSKISNIAQEKFTQQEWSLIPWQIKQVLIDIEHAKSFEGAGKIKVAIDLFGSALHKIKYFQGVVPKFLDIEQITKQSIKGIILARVKLNQEIKLPGFVLGCFNELNLKEFEINELSKFFNEKGVDRTCFDPNLLDMIFEMLPEKSQPAFFLDTFDTLNENKHTPYIIGDESALSA